MFKYNNIGFNEREIELLNKFLEDASADSLDAFMLQNPVFLPEGTLYDPSQCEFLGKPSKVVSRPLKNTSQLAVVERFNQFTAVIQPSSMRLYLLDTEEGIVKSGDKFIMFKNILLIDADFYQADSFLYANFKEEAKWRSHPTNEIEREIMNDYMSHLEASGSRQYRPHVFLDDFVASDTRFTRIGGENPYQFFTMERYDNFSVVSDMKYRVNFLVDIKKGTVFHGNGIVFGDHALAFYFENIQTPKEAILYISSKKLTGVLTEENTLNSAPEDAPAKTISMLVTKPEKLKDIVFNASRWVNQAEFIEHFKDNIMAPEIIAGVEIMSDNKEMLSISVDSEKRYPLYAFDEKGNLLPEIKKILDVFKSENALGMRRSTLSIASWFASSNSWLGSKTPMEMVATHSDEVLKAAKQAVSPVMHG